MVVADPKRREGSVQHALTEKWEVAVIGLLETQYFREHATLWAGSPASIDLHDLHARYVYHSAVRTPWAAQFLAVCSGAKPCEIGENLLSVSNLISRQEERLIHAGALVRPPTF